MIGKIKVASFGEIVWDVYKDKKSLGGAPLNFAYYCGKRCLESRLISAVGTDEFGREALEIMRQKGMDTECVEISESYPTGKVVVDLNESGQPRYDIVSPSAWDFIGVSPAALDFASQADAIAFGSLAQRGEKSRASLSAILRACPQKCLKVFDVNLRQNFYSDSIIMSSLELANVLKLNDEELPVIASMLGLGGSESDAAKKIFCRFNLDYLILTRGKNGHLVLGNGVHIEAPAASAKVVDTVGAGDAFTATFVAKILECAGPDEASNAASEMAALVVSQKGALV